MSLTIKNLSKSYAMISGGTEQRLKILTGLNLHANTSEVVAVVGSSGSGKSTFLSLVAGLDVFDQGEIWIDQTNIKNLSKNELTRFRAQKIGIIFQQFHLISHLTAFENLTLPLSILGKPFVNDEILLRLDQVGLKARAQHKPTELSGGECQRLALARGLITKPSLLLADEPSGSLDSETGKKVMDLFFEQARATKTTTVLVTHDLNLAQRCDRVVELREGALFERSQFASP